MTTIDLPDDLVRTVKIRAAQENRRLRDVVADLLRRGLDAADERPPTRHKVQLPLVRCAHAASPDAEVTAERAAATLADSDARAAREGSEPRR